MKSGKKTEFLLNQLPEGARDRAQNGGFDTGLDSYVAGSDVSKARVLQDRAGKYPKDYSFAGINGDYASYQITEDESRAKFNQLSLLQTLPSEDKINKEAQDAYNASLESTKPLTPEEERKKKLDALIKAKTRIGAQGITATYGAKLSPFLAALDQGSYNSSSGFVNPGTGGSIAAQIKSGQFGQVQDRLAKLYPTLNTQGQAQIKDLIPSLQSGAIQLKGNAEKQRKEAEAIAGEESKPITIKFDESSKKLIESLAPKENKTPDVTNTITVSVAGDATKETADKIVEGVKYELDAVVAFLSKNDGFAIPPKATA